MAISLQKPAKPSRENTMTKPSKPTRQKTNLSTKSVSTPPTPRQKTNLSLKSRESTSTSLKSKPTPKTQSKPASKPVKPDVIAEEPEKQMPTKNGRHTLHSEWSAEQQGAPSPRLGLCAVFLLSAFNILLCSCCSTM